MKKIFFLIVFLGFTQCSHAQVLKVSVGSSFSKLDWKLNGNTKLFPKSAASFTAGVGIEYLNLKVLSLSSNIEYLQKSGRDKITYTDQSGNDIGTDIITAKLNYVVANTYAKLSPPLSGKTKPFVNLGLYAGYLASVNKTVGSKDDFNTFNFGAVVGLGVAYKIGKMHIGIEANYLPSFNELYKTANASIKDQTFTAKLYCGIKL
jgi:hypothetical protein